jgi:spermidine synthase
MKFIESCNDKFGFTVTLDGDLIHAEKTEYNDIVIFDNKMFGRVMMLNDSIQLTSFDEHIYHEAMTKYFIPGLETRVLIIGGGDGGIAREIRKKVHKHIVVYEIDKRVSELSKQFFPSVWDDADKDIRCYFEYSDAIKAVKNDPFVYDHCFVDLTDPDDNSKGLYTRDFFSSIKTNCLTIQLGTPGMQDINGVVKELEASSFTVEKELVTIPCFFGGPIVIAHCIAE